MHLSSDDMLVSLGWEEQQQEKKLGKLPEKVQVSVDMQVPKHYAFSTALPMALLTKSRRT